MNSRLTPSAARKIAASLFLLAFGVLGASPAFATLFQNTTNTTPAALQAAFNQGGAVILSFTNTAAAVLQTSNVFLIKTDVILEADTNATVTLSGSGISPIFKVFPGVTLTVSNLTLSGGHSLGTNGLDGQPGNNDSYHNGGNGSSGGTGLSASGGAVYNLGTNIYINCTFLTNSATGGNGGNGGNGGDSNIQAGNGGNGGNGGTALGGAIYNANTLILTNCTFWGNFATGGNGGAGGGSGDTNNVGTGGYTGAGGTGGEADGAAIYNVSGGKISINGCTFAYNYATAGSSQSASSAPNSGGNGQDGPDGAPARGGAIFNASVNSITNSTFFNNIVSGGNGGNGGDANGSGPYVGTGGNGGSGYGGSIFNDTTGTISLMNCTLAQGQAFGGASGTNGTGSAYSHGNGSAGRGFGANIDNNGTVLLQNSILAYPTNASNFYGSVVDGGYNISSDKTPAFTATTSHNSLDPLLGTLADNGGPTETLLPADNSPVINAIVHGYFPPIDQRGTNRPSAQFPDIGAVEADLFDISGVVSFDETGTNGLPGVTVTAAGISFATTVTDTNGHYLLTTLPFGTYNITPELEPYTFSPANNSFTLNGSVTNVNFLAIGPEFFSGEYLLGHDWFYLKFADGTSFGYYNLGSYPYVYHNNLSYEYFLDAADGQGGVFCYDFTDDQWFYTNPSLWPYLYNFNPNNSGWVYYAPTSNPDVYTSNPRWFYHYGETVGWSNDL